MMRRKKVDPNAPPPPPRDNGLPPKPPELDAALKTLQTVLGKDASGKPIHVVTGFGFSRVAKGKESRVPAWRLFVFNNDTALQLPAEHAGFPVERREVPTPGPWRARGEKRAT